jgi:hypothetical protein
MGLRDDWGVIYGTHWQLIGGLCTMEADEGSVYYGRGIGGTY